MAVYGSDAGLIRGLIDEDPSLVERVHPGIGLTRAEVVWQAREEMARTVEDVLARRSRWLLLDAKRSMEAAPAVARILAGELGRPEGWEAAQVSAYTALARGYVYTDPSSRG